MPKVEMVEYKIVFGALAVITGLIGYIPYFLDIFKGSTKPHIFSWLVWAILETIGFFAQVIKGAGPGSWMTGTTAILCLGVFFSALRHGEKNITRIDWVCLASALCGIGAWQITKDPFWAVIIVVITDLVGFIPTFRKAYNKPFEETLKLYLLSALKASLALFALDSVNPTTVMYLASLVASNASFSIMLAVRRASLKKITV
ncbi:MAG: hypothetical protein M1275_03330 [Patescibacteria group bacterium]|nr:hypothetical protein [Patescibacteria group bacterium]